MVNKHVKIVLGITGASGSLYAKVLLDTLAGIANLKIAVVMSSNAKDVWQWELGNQNYSNYPASYYEPHDFFAPFASGSSGYDALVLCPCSMGTLARVAAGISDSLLTRTADVMLKERKKLICVVRETPYNLIHIQNMKIITEAGGIILPASPSFYSKPQTLEEAVATVTNRVVSLLEIGDIGYKWGES